MRVLAVVHRQPGGGVVIGKADELYDAAWRCDLKRVRGLLADGVDPNVPESDETGHGWSPLMLAARDPEVMAVLLVAGADPTYATPDGDLVVMAAARIGSPEGLGCRLPRAWDHRERVFATVMGPPGCQ